MSKEISVTVSTDDVNSLREVAEMMHRLADRLCDPVPVKYNPAQDEVRLAAKSDAGLTIVPNADEIPQVSEPAQINAEAAFGGQPVPVPPPTSTVLGQPVELDSRGLPWDQRIHASTKTKCKTGEW